MKEYYWQNRFPSPHEGIMWHNSNAMSPEVFRSDADAIRAFADVKGLVKIHGRQTQQVYPSPLGFADPYNYALWEVVWDKNFGKNQ